MEVTSGPYQGYVYAYPHKTAYRQFAPRLDLRDLWAAEPRRKALFLYIHIPFCEMRCGFCNLFTRTGAPEKLTQAYLDALDRQASAVRAAIGDDARFAVAAFGGGTPTYLSAGELERLFDIAQKEMGADLHTMPLSVETSPATATPDRLAVLRSSGTNRVSIGVQSFIDAEARAAVRPQKRAEVEKALTAIRAEGFERLNIDLIYGIDGQTSTSWRYSLDAALAWRPEEIYLYPLYVRPLTGLGRHAVDWDDQRMTLYREGRDHLLAEGYEQVSMRMFRLPGTGGDAGEYCCQRDGMVGLGAGARSYTGEVHYSFDYAVGARHVRAIIDDYVGRPAGDFAYAEGGFHLNDHERRRRYLIQSLLQAEGLDREAYRETFGTDAVADFPTLERFADTGWLTADAERLALTAEGLAHSDAIGPSLFSPAVQALMNTYEGR
ncbi:STM4012 family radical SAM protein [Sinosporangium siamense]|uniref:Heme chaperone HemW n=1 Tax=Sinosporangium siamense TaxID=1367973 RepID=A0A919REK0_9ACTN|nr:STM4012 family radical SAM protein [Sinosporangium siamense]GII90446.1 coproporphyrinogen III oxidase [Sinosporangium siamense]